MNAQSASPHSIPARVVPRVAQAFSKFSRIYRDMLASLGFAAFLLFSATAQAATAPALGNATSFAVLGGQSVTNTGNTVIKGDLGISPGNSVTGFPPGVVTPPGTIHAADTQAGNAQADVTTAYNALTAQACDFGPFGPTDLAGSNLPPGVYCYSSSVQNSGTLTLSGTSSDVWVFKIGSTLTTGPGSSVVLSGGVSPCNVFWQVGSSATLDTTTTFVGNILALSSISLNNAANIAGRALARNASVTLINNNIDATVCAGVPASGGVGLTKVFNPSTINPADVSTLTITLTNASGSPATLNGTGFTDNLPSGMVIAPTPNSSTTCSGSGTLSAPAGGTVVNLSSGFIIPTSSPVGSCTLTVRVTAATVGSFLNTLSADALKTDQGNSLAGPGALLKVALPAPIPTLSKWAMIMLTALLAVAGFAAVRRRQAR